MTPQGFVSLAVQTVTAPRDVARLLLALRLPREALVLLFALVIVGNALIFAAGLVIRPPIQSLGFAMNPLVLMAMQGAVVAVTIMTLTVVGRFFGGMASFEGMAILLIWLQGLRLIVQLLLTLLMPLAPGIGSMIMFVATALGAFILTSFIDEAHGFKSPGKAVLVLIFGLLAMAVALSFLLTLAGFTPNGIAGNV